MMSQTRDGRSRPSVLPLELWYNPYESADRCRPSAVRP